jgi:hypothetical protein
MFYYVMMGLCLYWGPVIRDHMTFATSAVLVVEMAKSELMLLGLVV